MKFKIEYLIKVSYSENLQVCDMRSYNVVNPYSDTHFISYYFNHKLFYFAPKVKFIKILLQRNFV